MKTYIYVLIGIGVIALIYLAIRSENKRKEELRKQTELRLQQQQQTSGTNLINVISSWFTSNDEITDEEAQAAENAANALGV